LVSLNGEADAMNGRIKQSAVAVVAVSMPLSSSSLMQY